jgi:hypothetical protein
MPAAAAVVRTIRCADAAINDATVSSTDWKTVGRIGDRWKNVIAKRIN